MTLPEGFHSAYQTVTEGGWIGLLANPEYGGMGLPEVLGTSVNEFFSGSNVAFSLTLMLTRGVGHMIEGFGTDEQKKLYVEKMLSGEWAGTMCLTEAQAGSDVGASNTKAVKNDDGSYQITGEKIFITAGEHDLTDNIIHLVLARTPGAPVGTKGLSLFIVPKVKVNADGSLGESNDVYCNNIEEKMGIHGSPTCTLVFGQNDNCTGYLLGEEGHGMKLMFHMMNAARIEVGLQGAAAAGATQQQATAYAHERLQSRHWKEMRNPEAPQVPIIEHPDVRRMLLTSKAYVEAMRAILLQTSYYLDMAHLSRGRRGREVPILCRAADPHLQGVVLRVGGPGHPHVPPGLRRLRLHLRVPGRAVHARLGHRLHLRGHQRDPGAGLRRPQAPHERRQADPRDPRRRREDLQHREVRPTS